MGQNKTVIVLPGQIMAIALGVIVIVFAYLMFLRAHSRKPKHSGRARRSPASQQGRTRDECRSARARRSHRGGQGFRSPQLHPVIAQDIGMTSNL